MCLFTKLEKPKVAEEDIPVWKFMLYNGESLYFPRFQYKKGMNYPEEVEYVSLLDWFEEKKGFKTLRGKWLHAFIDTISPESLIDKVNYSSRAPVIYKKMYIPKGTEYYEGNSYDVCAKCLEWRED